MDCGCSLIQTKAAAKRETGRWKEAEQRREKRGRAGKTYRYPRKGAAEQRGSEDVCKGI
jgi:hypothetical protein